MKPSTSSFLPAASILLLMTILRLATWNVCGLASDVRVGHVSQDFLSYNLSVAALQETKLRVDGITHRDLRGEYIVTIICYIRKRVLDVYR